MKIEPVETENGDSTERSKTKFPVLSVASLRKDIEPKSSEKLPANSKRYSDMYYSVYQKRAMKGSTVRRSETLRKLGKDQPRHTHYSIDCLGLTFGIPDFNFSLAGRKIHNPHMTHGGMRPTSLDPIEKKSLLPPLGKAIRPPFPMQSS
ncbi:hypothetical protein FSP39_004437 [Pinctada imbricata]|uniref:Uncharacterized protein n=1 Tax=Pinctada imbricata TaxID=66713 RepID=A0AA88YBY4_PINIB|nr:hypothetical protein FSP39_004437 [Pinctada imbricata]